MIYKAEWSIFHILPILDKKYDCMGPLFTQSLVVVKQNHVLINPEIS